MLIPVIVVVIIIPFALLFLAAASSDLAGANDDEYDSKIGYDKPVGWVATVVMLVILIVLMGAAGQGPLAGAVTVVH